MKHFQIKLQGGKIWEEENLDEDVSIKDAILHWLKKHPEYYQNSLKCDGYRLLDVDLRDLETKVGIIHINFCLDA